jgi:hypothetical protein
MAPPSVKISLTRDLTSIGVAKSRSCSRRALSVRRLSDVVISLASSSAHRIAMATTKAEIARP